MGLDTCSRFCLPSEKGSTLKGKNLLPFRVRPFSEGIWFAGEQTRSFLPRKKWYLVYQVCLVP